MVFDIVFNELSKPIEN